MRDKQWESYEEVAAYLLNAFATDFGLGWVDGKQLVPGNSGTNWEIDAKGFSENGESFVIVECKRFTKDRIVQEVVAGLAFRIVDTNASGGIIVTPIGLQEGANKVAEHTGILTVRLNKDCTKTDYILQFLNNIRVGLSDNINLSIDERITITLRDKDGNVIESREV